MFELSMVLYGAGRLVSALVSVHTGPKFEICMELELKKVQWKGGQAYLVLLILPG